MDLVSSKVITQIAGRAQPRGFLWKSLPRAAFASLIPTLHPGAGWVWLTFIKCQLLMGSLPFVAPLKTVWRLSGILCPCMSRDKLQWKYFCIHTSNVYWRFYRQINHIHTTTVTSSILLKRSYSILQLKLGQYSVGTFSDRSYSNQLKGLCRSVPFTHSGVLVSMGLCEVHVCVCACAHWSTM